MSDGAARTADGRLFQAAAGNERSPKVDRLTGGTSRLRLSWVYFRLLVGYIGSWVAKNKAFYLLYRKCVKC